MGQSGQQISLRLGQRDAAREAARFAVSVLSVDARRPWWMRATASVMAVVMYLSPLLVLFDEIAQAAPIVDPRAPIQFQPTITQTSTGVPAVNIAAPNANGISINSYQTFDIDGTGLVLNNSLVSGTPLLGGTLAPNPNLAGRTASVIVNQVTSTGPASTLVGPLEVFGSPASIIISNPNGISVNGLSLTNSSSLVLTTGTPQFLTAVGGTSTSFTNAGALAYNVTSGNITINGPAGTNGPGSGIEGTVGNIDVIAQTINLNAPLLASQRINLIAGNQLVTPATTDSSGTNYGTTANGVTNTAASIGNNAVAIDANQYGSVTSGQIYIVSTAAGMGVNTSGALSATAGNLTVTSNGDIAVASTYAQQSATLSGAGTISMAGGSLANQYTVNAAGDIAAATASVQSVQDLNMTAGGSFSLGAAQSNGSVNLTSGGDMSVGSLATGNNLSLITSGTTGNGDLTVGGAAAAPGTITITSARDATVNGSVTGGSTVQLVAQRSATVNGQVAATGDLSLVGQTGNVTTTGGVEASGNLNANAGQTMTLGGNVSATGNTLLNAGADLNVAGDVTGNGTGVLSAGGNLTASGTASFGQDTTLSAGQSVSLPGAVKTGGNLAVTAGTSLTVGSASAAGNATLTATAGAATVNGALASGGNTTLTAGTDVIVSGTLAGNGTGTLSAGRNLSGGGSAQFGSDATLTAGQSINLSGSLQTGGNLNATAGTSLAVGAATSVGNATLKANGGDATINGAVLSGGTLSGLATGNLTVTGSVTSLGATTLTAQTGNLLAQGGLNSTGDATLSAGQTLAVTGATQVGGDATLTGTNITTGGTTTVSGNLTASAQNSVDLSAGQLNVVGNATVSGANVTTGGALIGGNLTATASNQVTTAGSQTLVQGSATISGQNAVTNTGNVLAGGALSVTGANVTNGTNASLISTAATTVNATNLSNQGAISGLTTGVSATGSLTNNNGAIIGTNLLNITTGNLAGNQNGILFAGNTSSTTPGAPGNATVTVMGGNGTFNNTGGQILAQNNLTLNLQNQVFDPSAAASGTLNLGNVLTINTLQLNNAGTWAMPGNSVAINATQGISNSGTISKAGDITLSTNGTLNNSGTISAGSDVNLSGTVVNEAGGTIHANEDVNLTGVTTNAGTIAAVRDVNLNGSSFDNSGATTKAGRDLNANLSGNLTNVGGMISAQNNITINAANVDNSRAGANATTTTVTTTTVNAAGLGAALLSSPIGSLTLSDPITTPDGTTTDYTATITGRVGDLQPSTATTSTAPDLGGGTFNGIALPTVDQTTTTTQPSGVGGVIAAGQNLSITTGALNNHGSTISAGNNVSLTVSLLDNGGDTGVTTISDSIDAASYASFLTQLKAAYGAGSLVAMPGLTDAGLDNPGGNPVSVSANIITSTAPPAAQISTLTTYTSESAGQIVAGNNLALTGTGGSLTNAGNLYAGQDLVITANSFTNQGYHASSLTTSTGCVAGVAAVDCGYFGTTLGSANEMVMYERPGQNFTDALTNAAAAQELLHFYAIFGPNNDSASIYGDQTSTQTYTYTQTSNTVFAGRDLIIAAPTVTNVDGNLTAGRDVVIGGAGTTRNNTDPDNPQTNLTQASSVTNTSGNIQAGRNLAISTAALTNSLSAPVQIYQNYGTTAMYGCSGASYHYCDAFVDQQSGNASTISANQNVAITAGTVVNTGSLITAGTQVTIAATSTVTNQNQTLNAYWHDAFYGGVIGGSVPPDNFGCGTSSNCATLFGSAYNTSDGVQPPTPYRSLPGTIQAPSLAVTAGGQVQNSGNVMGQQVSVTGASIVNGLTSPGTYTPQSTGSQQVISLGPVGTPVVVANAANQAGLIGQVSGGLSGASGIAGGITVAASGSLAAAGSTSAGQSPTSLSVPAITVASISVPASPGVAVSSSTTAQAGANVTYLINNPASAVIGGVGPAQLLDNLPANLQPATTQFYYDPFTENQLLQQAALTQTGQASFISGLSYDSKTQASVTDQEKEDLYGNAIQYAKTNGIALGTALSQSQIASLDAPMLWYVEETVPEPGCTATGNATCPTVTALMPQVYLPQNYAAVQYDGTISGQNVTLSASNGGTITNTGSISATGTLTVNAGTLTNEQRSTDIGTQYTYLPDIYGLLTTTGTVVQDGGFMSAGNYQLNVDAVNQIGGALQKLNADGTVDTTGTEQQLAALKAQLGDSFTQSTVQNNLQTTFKSTADSEGLFQEIGMLAVMVVASVMTAGAASAVIGAAAPAGSTFAAATASTTVGGVVVPGVAAGLGNIALSAGIAAMASSALGQAAGNGPFSVGSMFESGGVAMLTAGLTNGITYNSNTGALGFSLGGASSLPGGVSTLGQLAGVTPGLGTGIPQSTATLAGNVAEQGVAIAGEATLQAGVQSALEGGSFLNNLKNAAVSDVAAAGAFDIGSSTDPLTFENVAEHAILGCAASAAEGSGCAGGALGAATSSVISPFVIAGLTDPGATSLNTGQAALTTAIAMLAGGGMAGLLGQNVGAGAAWAENEVQNNDENHVGKAAAAASAFLQSVRNLVPGVSMADQAQAAFGNGNYKMALALGVGSLADAGLGIATLGDSALAEQAASKVVSALDGTAGIVATNNASSTLYHYTNEAGMNGILDSETLNPSLFSLNPNDVRYGNGQYLSDIVPGTMTPAQLSRAFINNPFQGARYSNYVSIDVSGLNVVQGRPGVFVIPNETPLNLTGRIVGSGTVTGK